MEKSKLKKAIIFDCDNTLWDGVIGEEVIRPDWKLRDDIMMYAKRGVIIGICSKNNESDVVPMLQRSLLLWDYFIAVHRINWNDKASNLKEIAEELNIGMDAIVFVDDSPFERALVHTILPDILVIHPNELTKTVNIWFDLSGDLTKTQQYKENYQRAKHQEQFTNIDDYLTSLDMHLTIRKARYKDIERVTAAINKTNQFNLTSKRYALSQVEALMATADVFVLEVKDKFGDNGLTGVCIIRKHAIDTLLLSCRILGRNIEYAFLDYIIKNSLDKDAVLLIGKYVPSARNQQTADFYKKMGFREADKNEQHITTYILAVSEYKSVAPNYFIYER